MGAPALPIAAQPTAALRFMLVAAAMVMLLLLLLLRVLPPRAVPVVPVPPSRQQALPSPLQATVIAAAGWE